MKKFLLLFIICSSCEAQQINGLKQYNNAFPSSLYSGLQVWHTLSDQAGSNGSTITSVTDLSGNSRTGTSVGSQHTLKIESNGLKSLSSNGINDQINFSGTGVSVRTVAFLLKQNTGLDRWNDYYGILSYQASGTPDFTLYCDGTAPASGSTGRNVSCNTPINTTQVDCELPEYLTGPSISSIQTNGDLSISKEYHLVIVELTSTLTATTNFGWLQERGNAGRWFTAFFCDGWIWNRVLTHTEKLQLYAYCVSKRGYRNITDGSATKCIYFDGNSLTIGAQASASSSAITTALTTLGSNYTGGSIGFGSSTIDQLLARFDNWIALRKKSQYSKNIYMCWEGSNYLASGMGDGTACFNIYTQLCNKARAQGFTVVGTTVIDRQATLSITQANFDSYRANFNTLVKNYHSGLGENICDFAANANLSNASNTTYFNSDKIHLTTTGYGIVAGIISSNMP